MKLLESYRTRVRERPDSEHTQALLRTAIVWLLFLNTAWIARQDPAAGARLWAINVVSALFSVFLFARVLQRPAASPRRRVLGALHDNVCITAWLYYCGPMGALALFVYPFVTVGNGFRFGVRYLAWSGTLGALGIGVLVGAAPGWASFGLIGSGILLSHVVVTLYTGILLAHLRQTRDKLERMATSDTLTGLPNRRAFLDTLSRRVAAEDRGQIACLYLDLDGFKGVNDRYGHQAGDELLSQVGRAIRGCIRSTDLAARLGGDEFTVLLDGLTGPDGAKRAADRIIQVIEAIDLVEGQPVQVSASVGISYLPADPERPVLSDELLKAADHAMYLAKRSGKGRYRFVDCPASTLAPAA